MLARVDSCSVLIGVVMVPVIVWTVPVHAVHIMPVTFEEVYEVGIVGDGLSVRFANDNYVHVFTDGWADVGGILFNACKEENHAEDHDRRDLPCERVYNPSCRCFMDTYDTVHVQVNDGLFGADIGFFVGTDDDGDFVFGDPGKGEFNGAYCGSSPHLTRYDATYSHWGGPGSSLPPVEVGPVGIPAGTLPPSSTKRQGIILEKNNPIPQPSGNKPIAEGFYKNSYYLLVLVNGPFYQPIDCPGTGNPTGGTVGTVWLTVS